MFEDATYLRCDSFPVLVQVDQLFDWAWWLASPLEGTLCIVGRN